jgi:hypothetical protein
MLEFIQHLKKLNLLLVEEDLPKEKIINESSDVTYYELRKLMTMLFKTVKGKDTKNAVGEILKALTVMELKQRPVPTINKLKSTSPKVFGD